MDEGIWHFYDVQTGKEIELRRTDPGQYELTVSNNSDAQWITMDMGHQAMKDLYHALKGELEYE